MSSSKISSEKDADTGEITTGLASTLTKDLEATENKVSVAIFNKATHVDNYNGNHQLDICL